MRGGITIGTALNPTFELKQPFVLWYDILAHIGLITPKTYHEIMYGFGDNCVYMFNGYFLPKNWDTYLVYARTLNGGNQNYLGIGAEKMFIATDNLNFLSFYEIGADNFKKLRITVGIFVNVQNIFYKRKKH